MGTIFRELIRRFNEENNEEAGEHFTPRDVVKLMADLILLPIADKIGGQARAMVVTGGIPADERVDIASYQNPRP